MESRKPSDLGAIEGRYRAAHTSHQGEPLSVHPPSFKPSTRDRELRDPLLGEVAAQAQAGKLREPGLSLGGRRDRPPDLWLETSAQALRCRDRPDRDLTLHGGEDGIVQDMRSLSRSLYPHH